MIYNVKLHNGSSAAFEKIHRVRRAGGLYRIYEIKKLKYEDSEIKTYKDYDVVNMKIIIKKYNVIIIL